MLGSEENYHKPAAQYET